MKKRVLVTGGSGFLGINLIRYLLDRGYDITNLDFEPFDYADCKDKIVSILGDIRNEEDVNKAIKDADIVVHCAAALPLYSEKDIYSTDIDGTRMVIEAAKKNKIKRFVHISSTAVYGVPDHHPIYEDDKLIGVGPYGIAKIKAEEVCLEYKEKGMIVPIIRPKSFIGPERLGVFALLYDWALTGHNFPILGKGNNGYQLFDVEDLCESIYLCMTKKDKIVNDIFNVGAKEFTSIKEDFQAVLDEAGHNKKIICLPAAPAIAILKILEKLNISPLYEWVYDTVFRESFVSIKKAEKQLGFTPKYSNKDALIRNYKWYIDNLETFQKASGVSHRVPWKQGLLRLAKLVF